MQFIQMFDSGLHNIEAFYGRFALSTRQTDAIQSFSITVIERQSDTIVYMELTTRSKNKKE